MNRLLLRYKLVFRLGRIHLVGWVRHWERRPLAQRKREFMGVALVLTLCMASSLIYQLQPPPVKAVKASAENPLTPVPKVLKRTRPDSVTRF